MLAPAPGAPTLVWQVRRVLPSSGRRWGGRVGLVMLRALNHPTHHQPTADTL
jgi:hypothetical protein